MFVKNNYYRLVFVSNDTAYKQNRIPLLSHKLLYGQSISMSSNASLAVGDTFYVFLLSIPKSSCDFYNTLTAVQGDRLYVLSTPIANPLTNISGGMDSFSAYAILSKKM